jgi:nucleoside-diphosphate-sugar epimerase
LIHLDTSRIKALGWSPKHTIKESIIATVDYLVRNQWLLDLENV